MDYKCERHSSAMLSSCFSERATLSKDSGSGTEELMPRLQEKLLDPPVQEFRHIQLVLRRTSDLMNPTKLPQLLARFAEHA